MFDHILRSQAFSRTDRSLCLTLSRMAGEDNDAVLLGLLMVSWSIGQGHLCLDLEESAGKKISALLEDETLDSALQLPALGEWIAALESSPLVGRPGDYRPLVLERSKRLYLYRYWLYESAIADRIAAWTSSPAHDIDAELLQSGLDRFFPPTSENPDWQRIAAVSAMYHPFTVISGGPGTGKTTTVLSILLLLIEQSVAAGRKPRIVLAAPTGKAAARLMDAVNKVRENRNVPDEYRSLIPREAHTIHRLLKIFPATASPYNASNPLPADIIVVDESSMVDVSLMVCLMNAMGSTSRLILLGDRDQLASVEAGSVFGDICDRGNIHGYSSWFMSRAGIDGPAGGKGNKLADSLVILRKVHRYSPDSGIAALTSAVRDGDAEKAVQILRSGDHPDLVFRSISSGESTEDILRSLMDESFGGYSGYSSVSDALDHLYDHMILSPVRSGPSGIEYINQLVERVLQERGLIRVDRRFYHGRVVMVRGNDYPQRLFNGDMGIAWNDEKGNRIYFRGPDNSLKEIIPVRLPDHETVYAMTVHKSQGSEFRRIVLVLPRTPSPVMTRELLYTAISRARESLIIAGTEDIISNMIDRPTGRTSGLRDRIWD